MNRRGAALILIFMVIVVLVVLSAAIFSRSISESNIARKFIASKKALWAAEAGIARSAAELPNEVEVWDDNFGGSSNLRYAVPVPTPVAGYTNRWTITSTGRYILNAVTAEQIERTIIAVAEKPPGPNSDLITNTIETTGELSIGGSVELKDETVACTEAACTEAGSQLSFATVFGMTKDALRAIADHTYTNPPTNWQPPGNMVNEIVWIVVTGQNKYLINSNWSSGSGLLIVDGTGLDSASDVALDIAGGSFTGVIWVIGRLSISGPPNINGAIFAESGATINNMLTGNAVLNFSETNKDAAFNLINQKIAVNIISWKEQ